MKYLEEIEQISNIMERALVNGAKAFSTFSGKKVQVKNSTSLAIHQSEISEVIQNHYVLTSELKGEIKGKSYLFFTREEAENFIQLCLPPDLAGNEEMKEAVLLEFDNIVTAAVVTVISELTQKQVYAYVPSLQVNIKQNPIEFMQEDFGQQPFIIQTNARFNVENVECNPIFIWMFNESILAT